MKSIFPPKLTRLSEEDFENRKFLLPGEQVYYFVDYTVGSSYQENEVTSFLINFKRCPEKHPEGAGARWYKEEAIRLASVALSGLEPQRYTWVPLPPSKPAGHPQHDDRILRALQGVVPPCDIQEAIKQELPRDAQHTSLEHRDPERLKAGWSVEPFVPKKAVILLDDVLTSGCTFRAAKDLLRSTGVEVPIAGVFLTRAIYPRPDVNAELDFGFDF